MKIKQITLLNLALIPVGILFGAEPGDMEGMDMEAAMQEAMKRGMPGEHHKSLEPFAGKFETTTLIYMQPGEPPEVTKGSAEHTWIFDSRFIRMDVTGQMGDQTFKGLGFLGYDNIREEYTAVWIDNFNTGIMQSTGTFDPATRTYVEEGTFSCPMTGEKEMSFRGEWKVIDDRTLKYVMYKPGPDGDEVKGMEITYKRI